MKFLLFQQSFLAILKLKTGVCLSVLYSVFQHEIFQLFFSFFLYKFFDSLKDYNNTAFNNFAIFIIVSLIATIRSNRFHFCLIVLFIHFLFILKLNALILSNWKTYMFILNHCWLITDEKNEKYVKLFCLTKISTSLYFFSNFFFLQI